LSAPAFDVDTFLTEPLTARVATNGPTVRPMWYQWEQGAFWMISGPWARLFKRIQSDAEIVLVVDVCELPAGRIMQVIAHGAAQTKPFDIPRARRLLHRYLGPNEDQWSSAPDDYRGYLRQPGPPGISWIHLTPRKLLTFDFSYRSAR
jgi:Pyridoxamine 5'-phosphate oxidase